jgi:hypothetical protein
VLLYIERWLKAPMQMEDGGIVPRMSGTPQGGVISPILHYAFDMWMARRCPHIPFERYAGDAICHCKSAEEAQVLWSALADRFAACKLMLHPEKTKIVYCKDANRRGDFPIIAFERRLLLVFDGYSEGPRAYYRKQIITVLGQVEECGRLCLEARPIVLGRLHGACSGSG